MALDYSRVILQLAVRHAELRDRRLDFETQIAEINGELSAIEKAMVNLKPLTGEIEDSDTVVGMGLTNAVRKVFSVSSEKMSPEDVKKKLEKLGFNFAGYKMPKASVYTVLRRLAKHEEIEVIHDKGYIYYKNKPRR